jgi:hypothetical protein
MLPWNPPGGEVTTWRAWLMACVVATCDPARVPSCFAADATPGTHAVMPAVASAKARARLEKMVDICGTSLRGR